VEESFAAPAEQRAEHMEHTVRGPRASARPRRGLLWWRHRAEVHTLHEPEAPPPVAALPGDVARYADLGCLPPGAPPKPEAPAASSDELRAG
jgi:hypothetical protein